MFYKENWEETKERFAEFWNRENHDRCSLALTMRRADLHPVAYKRQYTVEETYNDPDCIHTSMVNSCEHTEFLYESVPSKMINFGTAGECQYFGAKPSYAPNTIWFDPILEEPDIGLLQYDAERFEEHKRITEGVVKRADGKYLVGMNDNCGIIDALAHLRGTENLLMDMLCEKEFVHAARDRIIDVWKKTQKEFFDIIQENNCGGSSHAWMQLWSPARHLQIQCDYSCMISPEMFEEFVLPELEETSSVFEHTTYHLDGIEQLRHLDMILSVKGIDNIQWTRVAGQPKTSASIEALRKIQKAGKGLVLIPEYSEIEFLMKNLSPVGLHLIIGGIQSREQADAIAKMARDYAN